MLRREPGIEVDDPRIVRLATRLRGTASDPLVVAQAILSWVHDSIVKDAGAAPLGAAQVVESRRGDCTEHARAFVALARAAGIPARGAAGLLYASGKFYYHAWAEVNLGKRFVAVDPMLGQFPADAAHLRWMSGSLELQTELMRLMGGLDLQVVGVTTVHELGGQASEGKELRPR
jgi:transglutaminase-like putative cysteine protease